MPKLQLQKTTSMGGYDLELAPALVPQLAVGISTVPGSIQCFDSKTIAYGSGRVIAMHSQDSSKVHVSEPRREVRHITAVALTQDKKYMAVAEAMSNNLPPQVTLLDVNAGLERGLSLIGDTSEDYTCVSFSPDGKLLVASSPQNNQPATIFHVWDLENHGVKFKSGTAPGFAEKVSINPRFTSNVFVQCSNAAFYMRLTSSGQYKPFPLEGLTTKPETVFVDHCWLPDGRMVLALSDRRLIIVDGIAVQHTVTISGPPACMAPLPDGGLLVATQRGPVDILKPASTEPGSSLTFITTIKPPTEDSHNSVVQHGDTTFRHISVDTSGNWATLHFKGGPIFMMNINFARNRCVSGVPTGEQVWEDVFPATHTSTIVAASMSMRRDYLVTASEDLTVRVWHWRFPFRLVAVHQCHHTPLAVAICPSGLEVVVAYVDCVRIYSVVEGVLLEVGALKAPPEAGHPSQELAKCTRASWSPTGHLIALTGGQGGKEVFIFSSLHRSLEARLKGHYAGIQDMVWSGNGMYLATASEGSVCTWHMEDYTKYQESAVRGCYNSAISCTPEFDVLVAGDASQGIRILETNKAEYCDSSLGSSVVGSRAGTPRNNNSTLYSDDSPRHVTAQTVITGGEAGLPGKHAAAGGGNAGLCTVASRMSIGARSHATAAGVTVAGENPLDVVSSLQGIVLPSRGSLQVLSCPNMQYRCVVGGGPRGSIRVCDLPPTSIAHYQEYVPHVSDITCLTSHFEGQWLISADTQGCWMLHAVLAPQLYQTTVTATLASPRRARNSSISKAAAAAGVAAVAASRGAGQGLGKQRSEEDILSGGATGRGVGMAPLPPYTALAALVQSTLHGTADSKNEQHDDVLQVRGSDMTLLKENNKELRAQLTKASTITEYKVYEKEQEVRRGVETEVAHLKNQIAQLSADLQRTQTNALEAASSAEADARAAALASSAALEAERQRFESMIAVEVERTNAAEAEVTRLRGKYGQKLAVMSQTHTAKERTAHEKVAVLQHHISTVQQQAVSVLEKAHAKMEHEVKLDSELAEEEITRVEAHTKQLLEVKDDRYIKLLAKHTLQGGICNQAQASNEELLKHNENLARESVRLSEQVSALKEELAAMHAAWADRDVKQRLADIEVKELGHQVAQSRLYTQLATSRITELSAEIEPLRKSKADAQTHVAKLEALQVRQAEQRLRETEEMALLKAHLSHARSELAAVKASAQQQRAYWDNFTTQLFRVIHSIPVDRWAVVLGKLHLDFAAGKDKLDWRQYMEETVTFDQDMSEQELKARLKEVQAQLLHNEKMMAASKELRERETVSNRNLVARLQAENVDMLAQLNQAKKDLKEANFRIDMLKSQLSVVQQTANLAGPRIKHDLRLSPPSSAPMSAAQSARSSAQHVPSMDALAQGHAMHVTHADQHIQQQHAARNISTAPAAHGSSPGPRNAVAGHAVGAQDSSTGNATAGQPASPSRGQGQSTTSSRQNTAQTNTTVTGDMPEGGWWLETGGMFEITSTLRDTWPKQSSSSENSSRSSKSVRSSNAQRPMTVAHSPTGALSGKPLLPTGRQQSSSSQAPGRGFTPATPLAQGSLATPPRLLFSPPTTQFSSSPVSLVSSPRFVGGEVAASQDTGSGGVPHLPSAFEGNNMHSARSSQPTIPEASDDAELQEDSQDQPGAASAPDASAERVPSGTPADGDALPEGAQQAAGSGDEQTQLTIQTSTSLRSQDSRRKPSSPLGRNPRITTPATPSEVGPSIGLNNRRDSGSLQRSDDLPAAVQTKEDVSTLNSHRLNNEAGHDQSNANLGQYQPQQETILPALPPTSGRTLGLSKSVNVSLGPSLSGGIPAVRSPGGSKLTTLGAGFRSFSRK